MNKDQISILGNLINLDLKEDTKQKIENLITKLDHLNIKNKIDEYSNTRLFYGTNTDEICVLENENHNYKKYLNVKEVLEYWQNLYINETLPIQ